MPKRFKIDVILVTSSPNQVPTWWDEVRGELPTLNFSQRDALPTDPVTPFVIMDIQGAYDSRELTFPLTKQEFADQLDDYVNVYTGLKPFERFLIERRRLIMIVGSALLLLVIILIILSFRK